MRATNCVEYAPTFRSPFRGVQISDTEDRVEFGHFALLLGGWVVAFMLGKELQTGFTQWQETRRGK
jgi:hypothetical protein